MQTTMNLLSAALEIKPVPEWTRELKLSRNALHTARERGNLSPAIAYALAEKMGQDAEAWALVAAVESERESACKATMKKRLAVRLASLSVGGNGRLRRRCLLWFWKRLSIVDSALDNRRANSFHMRQSRHRVMPAGVSLRNF
jgi:hypothetical protein